ncbi:Vinculin family-domain-containing protein [Chytridium lagenaria]|nr:Vinculin family-domain-containing protein [Chytridium lagenaria]
MHTTTSKSVLSPLAEAVTALILIISEAEISKTPMPDLSALAKIVDDQIRSLVGIGKRIAAQGNADDALRNGMPEACEEVLKASDLLLTSTSQLVRDPYSSPGRGQLLDSVRGILHGTTMVLTTFDDAEVRRIISASRQVRAHLAHIDTTILESTQSPSHPLVNPPKRPGKPEADPHHVYAVAVAIYGQAVVTLGQLTSKRITEILDPNLQARLHTAVKGLVRESPLLMSACRMALSNPGVVEARQIRSSACARMERVCREIEEVVRIGCEEGAGVGASVMGEGVASFTVGVERDVGKMKRKVDEAAAGIRSAVASSSEAALKNALYDYKQATTAVVADTKRTIDNLKSRELKNDLQVLSDVITHAEPKIASAAQAALDRPESPRHQQELLSLLDLASEKHSALVTSRTRALLGELTVSLSTLSDRRLIATPYVTFLESAEEGNRPKLTSAAHEIEGEALRMVNLTTLAQEGVSEGGKEIGEIRERLTGMVPALMSAGRMVVMNPADGTAKDYLEHMCNALDMHSEALETASNVGDTERFRKESNDLLSHYSLARRKPSTKLRKSQLQIPLPFRAKSKNSHPALPIGDLIRNHRGIVPDSIPDQPKNSPQLPTSPSKAAAQELKIEASHWTSKDNPIIDAVQKMSARLTDLATHHALLRKDCTPETKRAFITAAQQIMSEASSIVLSTRPIADTCTDKRLKSALLLNLDRIDTLAQQLKIIAAVKTASPGDTDRDLQLVGCAQNLMMAVKSCLGNAEAGSLRAAKGGRKMQVERRSRWI